MACALRSTTLHRPRFSFSPTEQMMTNLPTIAKGAEVEIGGLRMQKSGVARSVTPNIARGKGKNKPRPNRDSLNACVIFLNAVAKSLKGGLAERLRSGLQIRICQPAKPPQNQRFAGNMFKAQTAGQSGNQPGKFERHP
jgi:hypothetical protein